MADGIAVVDSDEVLLNVLIENKTIIGFFHAIFGFLGRRTDFYYVPQNANENSGFPPGVAEELVVKILRKCNPLIENSGTNSYPGDWNVINTPDTGQDIINNEEYMPTAVAEEVEITTTDEDLENTQIYDEYSATIPENEQIVGETTEISTEEEFDLVLKPNEYSDLNFQSLNIGCNSDGELKSDDSFDESIISSVNNNEPTDSDDRKRANEVRVKSHVASSQTSDSYNGAITENYSWSQSIGELDVTVNLPKEIKSSKQLKVLTSADNLQVDCLILNSQWSTIIKDRFSYKIKPAETVWVMSEGRIRIHIEKFEERWWHALLTEEPPIDTSQIDCSRPLHELPEDHMAMVREMQWNQAQKMAGKPTSDQLKQQAILKKAWHEEGSPFADTPFDPNIFH